MPADQIEPLSKIGGPPQKASLLIVLQAEASL